MSEIAAIDFESTARRPGFTPPTGLAASLGGCSASGSWAAALGETVGSSKLADRDDRRTARGETIGSDTGAFERGTTGAVDDLDLG
jgi:hypothetical protein